MNDAGRRLAAIMFTDMVGYTSLSQKDEALALQLLEEHRQWLRRYFAKHSGTEVKTMGDAFLVEFASALDAVRCAFDIQQSLHELNSDRRLERRIMLRIGIHLGDVIHSKGDIYGDAVNIASRIEPLAEPGEICISAQVFEQIRNKIEFPATSVGPRQLRNLHVPVDVYKIALPFATELSSQHVTLDRHRIAVLPLVNMISDPNDEYFADGMTEELISSVSKISELSVISRTSIMQYKNDQAKRVVDIGRELKVGTLLEGSVRKARNRVRISVQLIDVENDRHLWAQNYDRDLEDVFSIQSEIAENVAAVLKMRLLAREKTRIQKRGTTSVEAHALYLKGRFYTTRITDEGFKKAIECFEQAIEEDPRYALAYSGLSDSYRYLGLFEILPSEETFPKAKLLAEKAIELDDSLPEAHISLGNVLHAYEWDLVAAENEYRRSIELDPNLADAYTSLANLLMFERRFDEAISYMTRALELDPLSAYTSTLAGTVYLYAGRLDEAIQHFKIALELNPNVAIAHDNLGLAYVQKGQVDLGTEEIRKAIEMSGGKDPTQKSDLAYAYKKAGRIEEVEQILSDLLEMWKQKRGSATTTAFVYSILGDKEKTLEWLEKAFEERSGYFVGIGIDFSLENIRSDPRFQAFLKRIGLAVKT